MSRRLKQFLLLVLLVGSSFFFSDKARGAAVSFSVSVVSVYDSTKNSISNFFTEYFNQRDEIRFLREENRRLSESSELSIAFAAKLNSLLKELDIDSYEPEVKMVRALSYSNLGDYNKVWLDFSDFNASKVYGLSYQGYTAGIVVESLGRPLGLLQEDPKSTFSVYIGDEKIKGISFGVRDHIEIRYIPLWKEPQVGDEVVTSGLDDIFYEGLKVGKVLEVHEDEGYYTATVKPYATIDLPSFLHVVIQN